MITPLPIVPHIPDIVNALVDHGRAVVTAEPGAGKTTWVPVALLDEPFLQKKKIFILEPRRLATRMAAYRMAALLGQSIGQTIGYQIRHERRMGPDTRIVVMTEGVFTRIIQNDPALSDAGLVIFDEFHERSIHTDLGLALCLEAAEVFRDDLKLMVMSATINQEDVSRIMGGVPVIKSDGVSHAVQTVYAPQKRLFGSGRFGEKACAAKVVTALQCHGGDILVFLPGVGEIRQVYRLLSDMISDKTVVVRPLYGNLSKEEQDAAILPSRPGTRKVVLATSIAETSLTIQGVRVVIDSGFMRVPRYDSGRAMERLKTLPVSKASADQRKGRAGRLGPGICYRMWSEAEQGLHPDFNTPEILQADLTSFCLELGLWGAVRPETLSWLNAPPKGAMTQAKNALSAMGAFDNEGRITAHGRELAGTGLHPRIGHMVVTAREKGMGTLACLIAGCLGEKDLFSDRETMRLSDIRLRLSVLLDLRQGAPVNREYGPINRGVVRTILKNAEKLERALDTKPSDICLDDAGTVLAFAYPERIAMAVPNTHGEYKMASGTAVFLLPDDPLSLESMIVCVDLDGNKTRSRIFSAVPYDMETLKRDFATTIKNRTIIGWNEKNQAVTAEKRESYGEVVLSSRPVINPDPEAVMDILISRIREKGLHVLPWTATLSNFRFRAVFLRSMEKDEDFPDLSDDALKDSLDLWLRPFLAGIRSFAQLKAIDLKSALTCMVSWDQKRKLDEHVPTHLVVPSGSRIPLDYEGVNSGLATSPVLSVRLQEMFGCMETPRILGGRVPVTVQLLSPAGRVMQVTRDLSSFWHNTYAQVKKDLKGRYPKHYWPDDPLTAIATAKTKKQMDR